MTDRPLRVVVAEDSVILRDGMVELLASRGCQILATAGTAEELRAAVVEHLPDVAIVDVRLPPTYTDEGVRAAVALRAEAPSVGILLFSQHAEPDWAARLMATDPRGVGYLLKERVAATSEFVDALRRIAAGGNAFDPEIIARMMRGRRRLVDRLTDREREVLDLVAQGHSNRAIAGLMRVTERAVEKHVAAVFTKFDLPPTEAHNRRVKAVVAYLTEVGEQSR
jgi:DNA-binding NarL/FixJ family response regulator